MEPLREELLRLEEESVRRTVVLCPSMEDRELLLWEAMLLLHRARVRREEEV